MILVVGSTGFIGNHVIRALRNAGLEVKCLVRSLGRTAHCVSLGFSAITGDITDRNSLRGTLEGIDTVLHLVGIIEERGSQTFQRVHVEGTANLVDESVRAGIRHFIYVSAIGADKNSPFTYHRTKAQAEETVKSSGIPYTIFRPSLVIGPAGEFVGKMLDLIKAPGPFMPVPGSGKALFQPIYVEDLATCIIRAIDNPNALGRTFEVGGPEHLSYNELIVTLEDVVGRKKKLLHIPMGLVMPIVKVLERIGLSPVTTDQLAMLSRDNICDAEAVRKDFNFEPLPYRQALERSISQRAPGR